jgi:pimeloyl-ACP methyl ester carboxylesterase
MTATVADASITRVESADGTPLAVTTIGQGPPLVVCHGSFAVAVDWKAFATALADTRTVHIYDRRGHGDSPTGPEDATVGVELDDLAAVMAHAGPDSAVLGHSFGGGCALAWAARTNFAGPVLLYEPRHSIDGPVSHGHAPELRRLAETEPPETVLGVVLDKVIGLDSDQVAAMVDSPLWPRMLTTVGAFPGEVEFLDTLAWTSGDLDTVTGPSWLLVGEDSPILPSDRKGSLAHVLPGLKRVSLPGLGHFGYLTAPSDLAAAVRQCLGSNPERTP